MIVNQKSITKEKYLEPTILLFILQECYFLNIVKVKLLCINSNAFCNFFFWCLLWGKASKFTNNEKVRWRGTIKKNMPSLIYLHLKNSNISNYLRQ